MRGIFDKELCYMSPTALRWHGNMVRNGWDSDLAFCVIECLLGEDMYELPCDEDYAHE